MKGVGVLTLPKRSINSPQNELYYNFPAKKDNTIGLE